MTLVHLFPGQGAHRQGMGRELFPRYPHLVRRADALLGYSIEELCLDAPADRLTDTRYTQCSLYVVGALGYLDLVRESGRVPDYVAGHSLGEYVALFAAGAFDFLTGLELVRHRAEAMAKAAPGAMAAVIGLPEDDVREALEHGGHHEVDIANLNAPVQIVVSGPEEDVRAACRTLAGPAEAVIPLKVGGAFHSRRMAGAAEEFGAALAGYRLAPLRIPVVANTTARPHTDHGLAAELRAQLTAPVRWTESIRFLLERPDPEFHEVGPGQVLTGLVRKIREAAPVGAER
ncbi:ACP S-malonyltransferase [Kitasatospora sp. NPDC056327]|uniref:ACP S-malonyltransferase n=1 Tax=Kitasatospora sp. NPDC056327 TaxID=3345785 RepID=UPI0035DC70B8